jgi:uncharacterized protein YchJ
MTLHCCYKYEQSQIMRPKPIRPMPQRFLSYQQQDVTPLWKQAWNYPPQQMPINPKKT